MRNIFQKIVLTKHRLAWWVAGQSQWGQSEEKARALGQRGRLWSTWEEPWGQAQKFWVLSRKSCAYYFSIQIINWFREKKKSLHPTPTPCCQLHTYIAASTVCCACNIGDPGLIPGLGRLPGGGHPTYNPLQYSGLENPMDLQATVHGVTESDIT